MSLPALTLGTAGHIDHGKTALVRALTGTDTDRLPEEKRRGISISLGYAELDLPDGLRLSIVDVPGHERFVRTMVSGATGVDLFLLVVDAGEGPKPQTREHVEILRLLGIDEGLVALTKVDLVTPERIAEAARGVAELLPGHEVVPVSAVTGAGLDELRRAIRRSAARAAGRERRARPTRLFVDRAFSLPGAGLVVTGTLWSGALGSGDALELLPAGATVRVRGVEVHGRRVERAAAGQRVALAVSADRHRGPRPGDAIVAAGGYRPTYRVDVVLDGTTPAGVARLTVCHGTSAIPARLVPAGGRYAQLRLSQPLVIARGDRIVLRQATTVGGGRVLDPHPPRRLDLRRLELLEREDPGSLLAAIVEAPVSLETVRLRLGLGGEELSAPPDGFVVTEGWICSRAWLEEVSGGARAALSARARELDPGLPAATLLGRAPWAAAISSQLGLVARSGRLYLPGTLPHSGGRGAELLDQLDRSGLEPVKVDDPGLARQLENEGRLVCLGPSSAISRAAYERFRTALVEECERTGTISLGRFRDLTGVSRRVAQLVLERFDGDRLTLRVADTRRLRASNRRR